MSGAWVRVVATALLALSGFLAAPRALRPNGLQRVLRHLQPSLKGPSDPGATTRRGWLESDLDLVLPDVRAGQWLLNLARLGSSSALIVLGAASIWAPPLVAVACALVVAGAAILVPLGLLHDTATKARRHSEQELYKLLSQLTNLLSSGYSLPAAIGRLAEGGPGIWRDHLLRLQLSLDHGVELAAALEQLAGRLRTHRLARALTLLASAYRSHTAFAVCERLTEQEAESEYNRLLAEGERRLQLVWIPVAIATLVPGILLLLAPMAGSLKSIAGA